MYITRAPNKIDILDFFGMISLEILNTTYREAYPGVPHPPWLVVHKLRGEGLSVHLDVPEVDLD